MYKDSGMIEYIATSKLSGTNSAMQITNLINGPYLLTANYLQPIADYTIDKSTDLKVSFSITKNLYSTSIIEIELP